MKLYIFILIAILSAAGCSTTTAPADSNTEGAATPSTSPSTGEPTEAGKLFATPADALKAFVAAVQAKDEVALKAALSEKTNKVLDLQSKIDGAKALDVFDSKKFEKLGETPDTRNEKIDGDKATLETKDPDENKWDPMPFVKENGSWKLAFGDEQYDKEYENMVKKAKTEEMKRIDPKVTTSTPEKNTEPTKPAADKQ